MPINSQVHEAGCPDRLNYDQIVYQTTETKHDVKLNVPEIIDDVDETWDDASTNQVSKYLNIHCYMFCVNKFMAENLINIL